MGKVSELDDSSTVKATPATRAFARRSNVDIAHVTGRYVLYSVRQGVDNG